jgi:electron transfer flavoprotein beta subunit
MRILVCVKQVADNESAFGVAHDGRWVVYDDNTVFRMNKFDEFAMEEALQIRENNTSVEIDAISVGPARVKKTIQKAIEMGADNGIHIPINEDAYLSPLKISNLIASFALGKNYDLILTGVIAEDDMFGQVGPMLAELLNFSCATSVISEKLNPECGYLYVEREVDATKREAIEISLPAVLTIQSGINRPRYPSLSNVLRAREQTIDTILTNESDVYAQLEGVVRLEDIKSSRRGIFLNGTAEQKASELFSLLHERSLI